MLKAELRNEIDNRWEGCWPVNNLRPLVLIDCICYLLFFKKLQEDKLITGDINDRKNDTVYYLNNTDEFCWDHIKNLDAKNLHDLFNREEGIADILKNYGQTHLPYSSFLKSHLLINPSSVLLFNIVKIIGIIEREDAYTQSLIFEYLLHKEEIHSTCGQVYVPADTVSAIISLVKPGHDEIICDPACGNGDFLVNVALYISQKNSGDIYQQSPKIVGFDSDLVQLRIAAMNMILHGMDEPCLSEADTAAQPDYAFTEKPSVIISNLFFANAADNNNVTDTSQPAPETARKDLSILKSIITNLKTGSRAAVIIRNYILTNNLLPEVIATRKQLIDDYKIDAVINLPDKSGALSSDASILIFHLPENGNNDKIWFYKMKPASTVFDDVAIVDESDETQFMDEGIAIADVYTKPKTPHHKAAKIILSESFDVSVEEIKHNVYNLSYSQYKRTAYVSPNGSVKKTPEAKPVPQPIITNTNKAFDAMHQLKASVITFYKAVLQLWVWSQKKWSVISSGLSKIFSRWLAAAQKFLQSKKKLPGKIPSLNNAAAPVAAQMENQVKTTGKLNERSFALNKTASQLLASIQKFLRHALQSIAKAFTFKTSASNTWGKTQKFFDIRGKLITIAFTFNKSNSQLLVKTKKLFNKKPFNPNGFILNKTNTIIAVSAIFSALIITIFLLMHNSKSIDSSASVPVYAIVSPTTQAKDLSKQYISKKTKKTLTPKHINTALNDSSGAMHFDNAALLTKSFLPIPTKASPEKNTAIANRKEKRLLLPSSKARPGKVKYIVTDTTFFHDKPNERFARKSYLDPLRKTVLTPLQDSNGYIFIVYTNKVNITSKGWINKRSLKQVP